MCNRNLLLKIIPENSSVEMGSEIYSAKEIFSSSGTSIAM